MVKKYYSLHKLPVKSGLIHLMLTPG